MSKDDPEIEVIYIGTRLLQKGGMALIFTTPQQLEKTSRAMIYERASAFKVRKSTSFTVGGRYQTKGIVTDAGKVTTIQFATMKFLGRIDDTQVAEWELIDDAERLAQRSEAAIRKIKANKVAFKEFEQLRRTYRLASPASKVALELAVVRMLREGL